MLKWALSQPNTTHCCRFFQYYLCFLGERWKQRVSSFSFFSSPSSSCHCSWEAAAVYSFCLPAWCRCGRAGPCLPDEVEANPGHKTPGRLRVAEQRVPTAVVTFSAEDKRLYVSMLTVYKLSVMSEKGGKRFVDGWMLTLLLRSLASCPFPLQSRCGDASPWQQDTPRLDCWNCLFFFLNKKTKQTKKKPSFLFPLLVHKVSTERVFKKRKY